MPDPLIGFLVALGGGLLIGISTNAASKIAVAFVAGGGAYGLRVSAGIAASLAAAWAAAYAGASV